MRAGPVVSRWPWPELHASHAPPVARAPDPIELNSAKKPFRRRHSRVQCTPDGTNSQRRPESTCLTVAAMTIASANQARSKVRLVGVPGFSAKYPDAVTVTFGLPESVKQTISTSPSRAW
jgi:hypothetical protein